MSSVSCTELTDPAPSVAGPSTGEWVLTDVADNRSRGFSERMREKMVKIRQATLHPSPVKDSRTTDSAESHTLSDRLPTTQEWARKLEQRLREAGKRDTEPEHKTQIAHGQADEFAHKCQSDRH